MLSSRSLLQLFSVGLAVPRSLFNKNLNKKNEKKNHEMNISFQNIHFWEKKT